MCEDKSIADMPGTQNVNLQWASTSIAMPLLVGIQFLGQHDKVIDLLQLCNSFSNPGYHGLKHL